MDIKNGILTILQAAKDAPHSSGIYKMLSTNNEIIYIGKAKNLSKRIMQYTHVDKLPNRLKLMVTLVIRVEILTTPSEEDALILESNLIKGFMPKFNIALKDDKSFPYIAIDTAHNFPRLIKYRGKKSSNIICFGPFLHKNELEYAFHHVQKMFQIRNCTNRYFATRKRPCILYEIKKCSAPCTGKISTIDYKNTVTSAKKFLSGDVEELRNQTLKKMEEASNNLEFEKAAQLRDEIQILTKLHSYVFFGQLLYNDVDIIAIYAVQHSYAVEIFNIKNGQKTIHHSLLMDDHFTNKSHSELTKNFLIEFYNQNPIPKIIAISDILTEDKIFLEEILESKIIDIKKDITIENFYTFALNNAKQRLQKHLHDKEISSAITLKLQQLFEIKTTIQRIEVYDNSHISGKHCLGCMIVHNGIQFVKTEYRIFHFHLINEGDDYAMMQEMITRRFRSLNAENRPDLLMIDGGKQHLNVVLKTLLNLNIHDIKVIAIAKGEKRNAGDETFFTDDGKILKFAKNDEVLYYLQRLRDEAHRFAITNHRKLRSKQTIKSAVEDIPLVGQKRTKLLLGVFGSYEQLCNASVKELESVPTIGKKFAIKIYNYLHNAKDS